MKFPRLLSAFLAAILLFSLASCAKTPGTAPSGMISASPEVADFDLFVPKDWIVTETGNAASAYKSDTDPTSVSVMSWSMPYIDSAVDEWWSGYEAEFTLIFSDFTVEVEGEDTLLGASGAKKYVYTGTLGENTYRYTQYATVRAGVLYLMTFTELAEGTDHSTEFASIVENFAWR